MIATDEAKMRSIRQVRVEIETSMERVREKFVQFSYEREREVVQMGKIVL
jgi:hypothetical protein